MNKPRKRRLNLGDIYEIPLPNGENAYGRLFKECTLAIYKKRCNNINELPEEEIYESYIAVYKDLLQDGEWPVVSNRSFDLEEDAWPPAKVVVDAITQKGSLYHKGVITACSYEECKDLEVVAVWDRPHVIDRLMGNDVWEKLLGSPKAPHNSLGIEKDINSENIMTEKEQLWYLINGIINGSYDIKTFCSEFIRIYNLESNYDQLSREENTMFTELRNIAARFSDDEEELKISNMYFSEETIRNKVKEIYNYKY